MKNTKAYGAEIQDELRETAPEYEKWRRRLFIMNCVIATGVFLLEIGVNIILFVQGKVNPDIVYHLMRYLVVPSGLVFLAVLFDGIMMRCFPNKDWLLNYIMVLTVVFMCTVVAVTHYVFPITMTAFVIPVLMSVVFGNNRMTAATAASCSVCVILTGIWRNIDGTDTDRYYVVQEVVISLGIIFMSLIVAEIVNSLITEQNHRLLDALRKEKRSQQEAEAANMAKSSFLGEYVARDTHAYKCDTRNERDDTPRGEGSCDTRLRREHTGVGKLAAVDSQRRARHFKNRVRQA